MQKPPESGIDSRVVFVALAVVLVGSLAINVFGNGFPLGYHYDELRKVRFIQEHDQNFYHPILMLLVARIATAVCNLTDAQSVVEIGRTASAVFGTISVLASFLLFRRIAGARVGLWTAVAVAVMPTLVVHAHYLKEDAYLAALVMLSLHAFFMHMDRRSPRSLAWWGVATGLALSSKYVAVLLVVTYWLVPRVTGLEFPERYRRELRQMMAIAVGTFLLVNYPLFLDPGAFFQGLGHSTLDAVKGHYIRVWPWEYLLTFGLHYSLAPGMTWLWVALAVLGLTRSLRPSRGIEFSDRVLVTFLALWLGTAELSPTKPFPDFMRYAIPAVPILAFYAIRGLDAIASGLSRLPAMGPAALLLLALSWPAYESVRLVEQLENDSRTRVDELLPAGARVIRERYSSATWDVLLATDIKVEELRRQRIEYVVTSGFNWNTMTFGASLPFQKRRVYRNAARYAALFAACPYQTIPPTYKSYAFSNPELRVVHVGRCLDELQYPD